MRERVEAEDESCCARNQRDGAGNKRGSRLKLDVENKMGIKETISAYWNSKPRKWGDQQNKIASEENKESRSRKL
jgi:hypothetical protein